MPLSLKLQGLCEFAELVNDPLADRTFGGRILANGFVAYGPSALESAAALGLANEARALLVGKAGNSNPRHGFPAMWGPNYDWLPDQDHGSVGPAETDRPRVPI